jgi:hypothetical protein
MGGSLVLRHHDDFPTLASLLAAITHEVGKGCSIINDIRVCVDNPLGGVLLHVHQMITIMVGNYLNGVRLHGLEGRGEDRSLQLLG